MATHIGNSGVGKIGSAAIGELTDIEIEETADTADDTQLTDAWDTHLVGGKKWTGGFNAHWDEGDTAQEAAIVGASITFGFYPEGTGAGSTYKAGTGTIVSVGMAVRRNQTVSRAIKVQGNGALTQATV